MKRWYYRSGITAGIIIVRILIAITLLALPGLAWAKNPHFIKWETHIIVNDDSTFAVSEIQTIEFSGSFDQMRWNISLENIDKITDVKVYDEKNKELGDDRLELKYDINKLRIKTKIKAQDEQKVLKIEYRVKGGIDFLHEKNRLSWDVISGERGISIEKVEATVSLPQEVSQSRLKPKLLIGKEGNEAESDNSTVINGKTVKYYGENIKPYEKFRIILDFPKGALKQDRIRAIIPYLWFIVPLFVFVYLFSKWWDSKRHAQAKRVIIAQNKPHEDLSPAEMGFLIYKKPMAQHMSATFIDLACRGYFEVTEQEKRGISATYKTYRLQKQRNFIKRTDLRDYEQLILEILFSSQNSVNLNDIRSNLSSIVNKFNRLIINQLTKRDYLINDPAIIAKKYRNIGVLFCITGLVLFPISVLSTMAFVVTGLMVIFFGRIKTPETAKGIDARWHTQGFIKFMRMKERFLMRDRIDPVIFEEFLPYAIALNIEKEWVDRFAIIYDRIPEWYVPSGNMIDLSLFDFVSSIESMIGRFYE